MRKKQNKAKVISNRHVSGGYYKLVLDCPFISENVFPGQFAMLKVGDDQGLILRRALSVHRVIGRKTVFLYEVIGKGTQALSRRKPGESVDLLGPLGRGFDYLGAKIACRTPVLVAGGMGVAPLVLLAQRLTLNRKSKFPGKILVLIGAKTKAHILCEKEFKNLGCDVKIATDDGSRGFRGRVTALLEKTLSARGFGPAVIYSCGPQPMLEELCRVSGSFHIPAQVSLEAHMACGIGACLGCVVNTRKGYKRVCKEGPVFEAKELIY